MVYPFNSEYAFLRLYDEPVAELEIWERMQNSGIVVGVSGLDASGRAILLPDWVIEFPSYLASLQMLNVHVLLNKELVGRYELDQKTILEALKLGQVYFSLDLLGNPKGFSVIFQKKNKKPYFMGSKVQAPGHIIYQLPTKPKEMFEVVLYRNGQRIMHSNQESDQFYIEKPGHYRLVVRVAPFLPLPDARKWVSWIYSNFFYVQ